MKATVRRILAPPPPPSPSVFHDGVSRCSIPLTPALSAALSPPPSGGGSIVSPRRPSGGDGAGGAAAAAPVRILEVHPTLPRVAYVLHPAGSSLSDPIKLGRSSSSVEGGGSGTDDAFAATRIVVSDVDRNVTVRTWTVGEIARSVDVHTRTTKTKKISHASPDQSKGKKTPPAPPATTAAKNNDEATRKAHKPIAARDLGAVRSLQFRDRHALRWSCCSSDDDVRNVSPSLLIEFRRMIVCLSLLGHNDATILWTVAPSDVGSPDPTSAPESLTSSVISIGCSDGTIRFYDVYGDGGAGKVVKSVRGPNGRLDPVVRVVNCNGCASRYQHAAYSSSSGGGSGITATQGENADGGIRNSNGVVEIRPRVLSACASGVSYLWEFTLSLVPHNGSASNTSYSSSSLYPGYKLLEFRIRPPLARIDGLGSNVRPVPSASIGGKATDDVSLVSGTTSARLPFLDATPKVWYDPHRDFLLWSHPPGAFRQDGVTASSSRSGAGGGAGGASVASSSPRAAGGGGQPTVVAWDLTALPDPTYDGRQDLPRGSSQAGAAPRHLPFLVVSVPSSLTGGSGSGGSGDDAAVLLPGLMHAALPDAALSCLVGTRGGDLVVAAAPLATGSDEAGGKAANKAGSSLGNIANAEAYGRCSLPAELRRLLGGGDGGAAESLGKKDPARKKVRICSVAASRLRPDVVVLGTTVGVFIVDVREFGGHLTGGGGGFAAVAARHAVAARGGVVGGGAAVLLCEHNAVFSASFERPPRIAHNGNGHSALVGQVDVRDPILAYRSPPPLHLPLELRDRPVRLPPRMLPAPSGRFLCLFWTAEDRYEILHMDSLLRGAGRGAVVEKSEKSGKGGAGSGGLDTEYSPAVDVGSNVLSFAWVGDGDVFAVLRPPRLARPGAESPSGGEGGGRKSDGSSRSVSVSASPATAGPALQQAVTSVPSKGKGKGFRSKFKLSSPLGSTSTSASAAAEAAAAAAALSPPPAPLPAADRRIEDDASRNKEVTPITDPAQFLNRVELKVLIGVNADAAEIGGSVAAATATTLGDVTIRGGTRLPPTALFGGPVLGVGSLGKESSDGMARFYTSRTTDDSGLDDDGELDPRASASVYVAVGPTLPYPDLVVWDEDEGRLCAVIVGTRVAIYLSEPPRFTLLGTTRLLGAPGEMSPEIESAKFIHGVLFCSTGTSVQCTFLGDLENEDGVCECDTFVLASTDVPGPSLHRIDAQALPLPFAPEPTRMALNRPSVLTYHGGSLLVSTVSGLHAVPLHHPLLRIGTLLSAGHLSRAQRWFDAVPLTNHESLANFLDRRGAPDLAVYLPGLSLETVIDLCLRYGLTERLEGVIDAHGLDGIRRIDAGKIPSGGSGHSLVVCVGAYLLSEGKAELVRRLATECMVSGEEGRREAFVLASLLLAVDPSDARRLVKRAVGGSKPHKEGERDFSSSNPTSSSWPVGDYVRDYAL